MPRLWVQGRRRGLAPARAKAGAVRPLQGGTWSWAAGDGSPSIGYVNLENNDLDLISEGRREDGWNWKE